MRRLSRTAKAVQLRRQRIARSYVETQGDSRAVAEKHHVSMDTVRDAVRHPSIVDMVREGLERQEVGIDDLLATYKEGMKADRTLISPRGDVVGVVPDHGTRIQAANGLRDLMVKVFRPEREEEPEVVVEAPRSRLLTPAELMALSPGVQQRVVMERQRVIIEPVGLPLIEDGEE